MKRCLAAFAAALLLAAAFTGCRLLRNVPKNHGTPSPVATTEQSPAAPSPTVPDGYTLVTPENPESPAPALGPDATGLPEAQPFANYTSYTGSYDVQAPEGWKPDSKGTDVTFQKGYSGISVEIVKTAQPASIDTVKNVYVAELVRKGRAVNIKTVEEAETKSGPAVHAAYESNSEPAAGKQVRLENHRYYFGRGGIMAVLTIWAPAGADNRNLFLQIPDTFFWR